LEKTFSEEELALMVELVSLQAILEVFKVCILVGNGIQFQIELLVGL
jgi:hypothetical protein